MNVHAFKVVVSGGTNYHRRLFTVAASDDNIGRDLPPNHELLVRMRFTAATASDLGWVAFGGQIDPVNGFTIAARSAIMIPGKTYRLRLPAGVDVWATNPGGSFPGNGTYSVLVAGLFPQYP